MSATITRNCKERTCRKPFTISVDEAKWLRDKGLEPFKRCPECRKKRRNPTMKWNTWRISAGGHTDDRTYPENYSYDDVYEDLTSKCGFPENVEIFKVIIEEMIPEGEMKNGKQ